MEGTSPIENASGVDVSQIRRQLALSVPDRVREMVHAANVLVTIREHVRSAPPLDE